MPHWSLRQPPLFLLAGLLQYILDSIAFSLLIYFGVATSSANVLSRAMAAVIGFGFNRYVTFGQREETLRRLTASLLRFAVLWLVLTAASTVLILALSRSFGEEVGERIVYKLAVEAVLAVISFLASRYWVYRR
jgi:putative flippase GtrA